MKTAEQAFREYTTDEILCFHGHVMPFAEFAKCCENFFKNRFGMKACYWRILAKAGMEDTVICALRAMDMLSNDLDNIILNSAFDLTRHFQVKLAPFMDPKNLIRYETEAEVEEHLPVADWGGYGEITRETVQQVHALYLAKLATKVVSCDLPNRIAVSIRTQIGKKPPVIITQTRKNFIAYLELLSGIDGITEIERLSNKTSDVDILATLKTGEQYRLRLTTLTQAKAEPVRAGKRLGDMLVFL
jgi:hypothetical protein